MENARRQHTAAANDLICVQALTSPEPRPADNIMLFTRTMRWNQLKPEASAETGDPMKQTIKSWAMAAIAHCGGRCRTDAGAVIPAAMFILRLQAGFLATVCVRWMQLKLTAYGRFAC